MSRPHLAYLAFWFPPSRASGVYRALATVDAFVRRGWRVTVFTCDLEYLDEVVGSTDPSLLEAVPDGVSLERVPFPQDGSPFGHVSEMRRSQAHFPAVWRHLHERWNRSTEWVQLLRGRRPDSHGFSDPYVAWIDPVVRSVCQTSRRAEAVDLVLATGNPFSSFQAARLAAELVDVPYMVDYRDPWSIDVFTGAAASVGAGARHVEREIMSTVATAVHVNEAIAEAYRVAYPEAADRQAVVWNGFDIESRGPVRPPHDGPLRFGVLGTVNDRWPLDQIVAGWLGARDRLPAGSEFHLAGHLGYFARSAAAIEMRLPDPSTGFRYVGPRPKRQVADFYSGLDVVVVPAPGGRMVTSGKVFEAMALGIPLVVVQDAEGGAREVSAAHPLAIGVEPDGAAIEAALLRAAEVSRCRTLEQTERIREEMMVFERRAAMAEMVDLAETALP